MKLDLTKLRPNNFNSKIFKQNQIMALNVEKGSGNRKIDKCPICKSAKREIYQVKYNIPIFICLKCDVGYAGLQPRNLNDVYSNNHYLKKLTVNENRKYRIQRFGKERVGIVRKYKKKGSILDFGCGSGYFLETAKKYFDAEGVELSDNLRDWLKKNLNIISYKNLSDTRKKYNVITAFDVLEHVSNPISFLKEIKKKLKPKGIILIYTPNRDSLGFNYLGYNNNLLVPPAHLFYFNKTSLDILFKKAGFKIIETQYKGLDIGDIYAFFKENKKIKTANFLKRNADKLQNYVDKLHFSNAIRIVIKKN